MRTSLFDYDLPGELIAQRPPAQRDGGRLMVLPPQGDELLARIADLPQLLPEGALLVANDSRVIPARLRARRPTGGAVEVLLVRELEAGANSCRWRAMARANRPLRIGDRLDLLGVEAEIIERSEGGYLTLETREGSAVFRRRVDRLGEVPLPPYIRRAPERDDRERYQTVFAREDGSVAAPTAGLHLGSELLEEIAGKGHELAFVTLHVGPGTFRPIATDELEDHRMDAEAYSVGAKEAAAIRRARDEGRAVIAVGTTVVRALEGLVLERGRLEADRGLTELFIAPPFDFRVVDGLLTNFHLPRSTLLCLVAALAGRERLLEAYRRAVRERFRFYSYGDAMLVLPRKGSGK
ncbi:MAG: tRNA preQ1(34) S-adenosylmethionine ribosyltransferase-isomerase QueA [Polyangia bacterium]